MTFTRDSVIWWIGIIGSLVGIVLAQADALGLPPHWKVILTVGLSFIGTVSGKLATSPLQISPDGHAAEVVAHNEAIEKAVTEVQVLAKTPPIPPVTPAA